MTPEQLAVRTLTIMTGVNCLVTALAVLTLWYVVTRRMAPRPPASRPTPQPPRAGICDKCRAAPREFGSNLCVFCRMLA